MRGMITLFLILGFIAQRVEAQHYSGRIQDKETAHALVGVEVLTERGHRLARTDDQGLFSFDYPVDSLRVILSADSYRQGYALFGESLRVPTTASADRATRGHDNGTRGYTRQ